MKIFAKNCKMNFVGWSDQTHCCERHDWELEPSGLTTDDEGVVFEYNMHCSNGFPVLRAEVESITPDLLELSTFGTIELDRESAKCLIAQLQRFVDGDLTLEKATEFNRVVGEEPSK